MILEASAGDEGRRAEFVAVYGSPIRAYLEARWRGRAQHTELEDAIQEVFLECLREGGVLERCREEPPGGFRPFLLAVVRNIARRVEERRAGRKEHHLTTRFQREGGVDEDTDPARMFDRTWAVTIVRNARRRVEERLGKGSPAAQQRVELLRLRYQEGVPVKEIAPQIGEDPRRVHHQLEEARRDFHRALREEVAFHLPGNQEEVEQECRLLLGLLARDGRGTEVSEF